MSVNINGMLIVLAIFGGSLFVIGVAYLFVGLCKKIKCKNNIYDDSEFFLTNF